MLFLEWEARSNIALKLLVWSWGKKILISILWRHVVIFTLDLYVLAWLVNIIVFCLFSGEFRVAVSAIVKHMGFFLLGLKLLAPIWVLIYKLSLNFFSEIVLFSRGINILIILKLTFVLKLISLLYLLGSYFWLIIRYLMLVLFWGRLIYFIVFSYGVRIDAKYP